MGMITWRNSFLFTAMVGIIIFSRWIPHPANVTPMVALFLFATAFRKGIYAFLIPVAGMALSDIFLGYSTISFYVYGSFLLIYLTGFTLRAKKSFMKITVVTLASSTLFFLMTNFGVWLHYPLYEKTAAGLILCYTMALPFFRNAVLGDLIYTYAVFAVARYGLEPLSATFDEFRNLSYSGKNILTV